MFHLDLPNVYKVLTKGELVIDETVCGPDVRSQPVVVVSIFGSTLYQAVQDSRFKRAFQLALDGFGTCALYSDSNGEHGTAKESADIAKTGKEGGTSEVSDEKPEGGEKVAERSKNERSHLTQETIKIGGKLEGFLNEDESVLILHIEGFAYDAASCMEACRELRSSMKESGFLSVWSSHNTSYCKWLVLLFSLSHIMVLSETGSSFDTSYISLFRALDNVRQDLVSPVSKILSSIEGLSKQWVDHGRLCSPRLLFLFETESASPRVVQSVSSITPSETKEKKDALQNEIYQIFRKCRIITNISANSLFAVPASDDFVFVFDKSAQNSHSMGQSLAYTCIDLIGATTKRHVQKTAGPVRTSSNTVMPVKMSFRSDQDTLTYSDTVKSFRKFLLGHISVALEKGFDDDYRRVSGTKHFFVRPTLSQWETAYLKLSNGLILETTTRRVSEAFSQMQKLINIDAEYLEIQCSELFPKVYAAYQRGLPEFYTAQQHQAKLSYAVNVFLNISRGSTVLPWLKKLANKCEKYWKNGRQQCETLSLLGHVCANPIHRVRRKDHLEIIPLPDMEIELPEMSHNSSSRIVSYCNCGKRQGSREEPFTIREANFDFYKKLAKDCCDKLDGYDFTVFTPSEESTAELSLQEMLMILQRKSENLTAASAGNIDHKTQDSFGLASQEMGEVFEAELRQENDLEDESDSSEDDEGVDDGTDNAQALTMDTCSSENKETKTNSATNWPNGFRLERVPYKRNSSTVEYLPGMFHSKSPKGLLALFPSWSLVCLGPSSIYSHAHGVHQPGFLNGANSLLPWDVKVKAEKGVTYAPPPRLIRGRRHNTRQKLHVNSTNPTDEFTVKVFFGYEYECRKGHRFFCDSEKVLYTLNNSAVTLKTVAAKVIATDMPLYANCPCKENRDGKFMIAQLLRIHIVTPKAPVFVTVNPKVQPGPSGSCPVFSTSEDSIRLLPSTYWIFRLPFSYVGELVYVPPSDLSRYNGKLLRGGFNVVSMSPSETDEWERQNQNRL